jgi:hypothetical protein
MPKVTRALYILVGFVVFVMCGWLAVSVLDSLTIDPNKKFLAIPLNIWVGIIGSIAASGIFFTITESLRWIFDKSVDENFKRLFYFEQTLGIKSVFSQKGGPDAKKDYKSAIASAKSRVWAFGVSNGEFIKDNLDAIVAAKKLRPKLDIEVCFVDPSFKVKTHSGDEYSLVQVFDSTRDPSNSSDNSSRVSANAKSIVERAAKEGVAISTRYISGAGYISGMVVDDWIYFFPFTAVRQDNTTTPLMKLSAHSEMGQPFIEFLSSLIVHPLFSRPVS